MLADVSSGDSHTLEWLIEEEHCTIRGEYRIFATPDLVLMVEAAAIELLAPHLPEGQSSVGSKIDIAHTAPTLLGQRVRCTATVTVVDRRRVEFDVEAHDGLDTICTGSHERFVVDLDKFGNRLAEKAAAVAAG
ncbi:MAG: fluoroacetyl-CoA thioesterase [Thermoleophilaceae bacterium]|jgi:predicted thioesterase|nr:fluoroacetyl-CoA thioesterase [Thermoleophilaceae bacterium]